MYYVLTTILVLIDFNEFILLIDIVRILVSSRHCLWCVCDSTGSVFVFVFILNVYACVVY